MQPDSLKPIQGAKGIPRRLGMALCLGLFCMAPVRADDPMYSLGQMASGLREADSLADFASRYPSKHDSLLKLLRPLHGNRLPIAVYLELKQKTDLSAKKRLDRPSPPDLKLEDMDWIHDVAKSELRKSMDAAKVSEDKQDSLLAPVNQYYSIMRDSARARNLEIVRRYEMKFGPRAPRLNLLETFFAAVLQKAPGFGPGPEGPGRLEWVASYSTTYFFAYQYQGASYPKEFTLASMLEFGLRCYQFTTWGPPNSKLGLLTPDYVSAGLAWSGNRDWFFVWPGDGELNLGGFLDVGGFKIAVIPGENTKVYLGRQFQVVPYLF